jgi:hypothetical protein
MNSNEKLSTTKFHNFSRSTTFILVVSPSEVIYKIWISNLKNADVVFHDKMISNEKVINYKVSLTFGDLQLSFLLFVHTRSFKKFKFQNFENSNIVFLDQIISN